MAKKPAPDPLAPPAPEPPPVDPPTDPPAPAVDPRADAEAPVDAAPPADTPASPAQTIHIDDPAFGAALAASLPDPVGPARQPWRVVAFAKRAVTLPLGGGTMTLCGGEWLTEPADVATLRGMDDVFELVPVESPAHLAEIRAGIEAEVARATTLLRALGRVVLRDGEPLPKRPR